MRWTASPVGQLFAAVVFAGGIVVPASGQAPTAGNLPPLPAYDRLTRAQMEGAPALPDGSMPGTTPSPVFGTEDLNLPAAERSFGGGGPTYSALAQQEAQIAAEQENTSTPLMRWLGMEESPWQIYGWIQNSFTGNPSFPADGVNFGVTPNVKSNQWMGNQYYTIIENALEREGEFNIGGRLDVLFGNDWEFNKMRGVFDGAWPSGRFPGLDLAQFYGEMHLPILSEGGVDVKFGRWYTLHGYEVVPAIGRPLLSVPYMFTFGQPFTHWGLMTTWNVNDNLILYNGSPQGWDDFQNRSLVWTYMGGFSYTGLEEKLNLTFIYSYAVNQFHKEIVEQVGGPLVEISNQGFTSNFTHLWTTVLSYQWTDQLTQVLENDNGYEPNVPIGTDATGVIFRENSQWHSFGNWFLYDIFDNGKLTGVWRSEVFWDINGLRTGFDDRFYEQTVGLIWKPHESIWIRPEARYDWSQFTRPFNAGVSKSQFTMGFDVILLF